jgi:hypothetical protein
VDIENGLPESWGFAQEHESAEGLFTAQDNREIHSLTLTIVHDPARDLNEEGREGWKGVFATSVNLRLLVTPNDGLEVTNQQANYKGFQVNPPTGRWYIGEWIDLPRP